MEIVTLTMNPAIDLSASVDKVVVDAKLRCQNTNREAGGGGINVAKALVKLGGESLAVFPAGGATGQLLELLIRDANLQYHMLEIEEWTRENFIVFEESTNHQYRFIMPGPTLSEEEWRYSLTYLSKLEPAPRFIVGSGSLPPGVPEDFYAQVAEIGKERGSKVIIDTKGRALELAAEAGIFLLKPNMRELAQLSHKSIQTESDIKEAASSIVQSGKCEALVLSIGKGGAILFSNQGCYHVPSPTVPIRSTVGSGDSMVSGILLALQRGEPIEEAILFGVAAGAAAVMTPGTELCRREDTERLYQQIRQESLPYHHRQPIQPD